MSRDINMVQIIGGLGRDANGGLGKSGKDYTQLSVATQKSVKKGEACEYQTTWVPVVLFGSLAKHINGKQLKKGDRVLVIGELSENKYTNKEGVEIKSMQIIAKSCEKIDNSKNNEQELFGESGGDFGSSDHAF